MMFTESLINLFYEACQPLIMDRTHCCQDWEISVVCLPCHKVPSFSPLGPLLSPQTLSFSSPRISQVGNCIFCLCRRLADGSGQLCLESQNLCDYNRLLFPVLLRKRHVPAFLPLFMQLPKILFTPISINLYLTYPSRLRFCVTCEVFPSVHDDQTCSLCLLGADCSLCLYNNANSSMPCVTIFYLVLTCLLCCHL